MTSISKQRGSAFIGLLMVMAVAYLFILFISLKGWGYMGYGGYHRGVSSMYWGGPSIHRQPSVRDGSIGGPNRRGGGYSGGK